MITEKELQNICITVAKKLVILPNKKEGIISSPNLISKLIFPQKRAEEIRYSEQESRILFCNELENYSRQIFYSVETPTAEKYRFGKTLKEIKLNENGQSALIDMSLFEIVESGQFVQKVNIEFKAHNVEVTNISKDILKLFAEKQSGLFFHTVKAINSGTLNNDRKTGILDKYKKSIMHFKCNWVPSNETKEKFILFAICILSQKILLQKTFKEHNMDEIEEFFKIDFKPTRKEVNFTNINNWIKEVL